MPRFVLQARLTFSYSRLPKSSSEMWVVIVFYGLFKAWYGLASTIWSLKKEVKVNLFSSFLGKKGSVISSFSTSYCEISPFHFFGINLSLLPATYLAKFFFNSIKLGSSLV